MTCHILRDCDELSESYEKSGLPKIGETTYKDSCNREQREYHLTRMPCLGVFDSSILRSQGKAPVNLPKIGSINGAENRRRSCDELNESYEKLRLPKIGQSTYEAENRRRSCDELNESYEKPGLPKIGQTSYKGVQNRGAAGIPPDPRALFGGFPGLLKIERTKRSAR